MGFRTGAYAKVWEVTPMSDTSTKVRMSISRKNKQSGEYEQDFSGFVLAIGTAAAKKAASLKEGNRIKLGDVDVTTKYDKEKKVTYNAVYAAISKWQEISASLPHHLVKINSVQASVSS